MKKTNRTFGSILSAFLICSALIASPNVNANSAKSIGQTDEIHTVVDKQPEFPGGMKALFTYFFENMNFPKGDVKEGRVICQFTVTKEGNIEDAKVLRGVAPELDQEALRLVAAMPKWIPGEKGGAPVNSKFVVPVVFKEMPKISFTEQDFEIASKAINKSFPGGTKKYNKYIKNAVKASNIDKEGRVVCQFTVKEDGSINDVKVLEGTDSQMIAAATKIISEMPKWEAGSHCEGSTECTFITPVIF